LDAAPTSTQETIPVSDEVRPVTAFDIKAAAEYLGISYAGVYDLIKRGRLPAHGEVGKRWLKIEELDQYIASRKKTNE
jgi:excisionase family DNA binding protein